MVHTEATIVIDRPVEMVFEVASDFGRAAQWRKGYAMQLREPHPWCRRSLHPSGQIRLADHGPRPAGHGAGTSDTVPMEAGGGAIPGPLATAAVQLGTYIMPQGAHWSRSPEAGTRQTKAVLSAQASRWTGSICL